MKVYQENIKKYHDHTVRLKKVLNELSLLRLGIFVVASAILITLFSLNTIAPIFIVFPIAALGFGLVVKHHNNIAYQRKHAIFLKSINESEVQREKCLLDAFDPGQEFIDPNHPYTSDLDIFGQHSVFQLINRTTTESGRMLLSKWLSAPAPDAEIYERQKAIRELSGKLEWRQDFQASGMHFQNKKSQYSRLLDWVQKPVVLLKHRRVYIAVALILSVLSLLGIYLTVVNFVVLNRYIYFLPLASVLFVNYLILRKLNPLAEEIAETASENLNTLRSYRSLINKIESEGFGSEKLHKLQLVLTKGDYSAYHEINRLSRILDFSHQRPIKKDPLSGNHFYFFINIFLLLDIYLILGTEKWKSKNSGFLKSWAEAVSEFEGLNSFAGFSFSNPSYTFPEIAEKNHFIEYELLGHPLIASDKRVCNNFRIEGAGDVVMITGSNMGGKSTFLRTVGVNVVLALAGAPCCAKSGRVSNLKLFSSMRTQDNLKAGVSSFYAELDRIEKLLNLIKSSTQVFFLLDEMFKGTNSEDRHKGGFSLINQISKLNTSGIIATHDIELAKLSENKKFVTNYSFNSEINGNSMVFSYDLHPGICNDFNASALMERSGIEIIPDGS